MEPVFKLGAKFGVHSGVTAIKKGAHVIQMSSCKSNHVLLAVTHKEWLKKSWEPGQSVCQLCVSLEGKNKRGEEEDDVRPPAKEMKSNDNGPSEFVFIQTKDDPQRNASGRIVKIRRELANRSRTLEDILSALSDQDGPVPIDVTNLQFMRAVKFLEVNPTPLIKDEKETEKDFKKRCMEKYGPMYRDSVLPGKEFDTYENWGPDLMTSTYLFLEDYQLAILFSPLEHAKNKNWDAFKPLQINSPDVILEKRRLYDFFDMTLAPPPAEQSATTTTANPRADFDYDD